jgi:hypothetical protein
MERGQYQIFGWSASAAQLLPAPSATFRTPRLFIPLQLPLAPMCLLAVGEHALDVAVECPHDAYPWSDQPIRACIRKSRPSWVSRTVLPQVV